MRKTVLMVGGLALVGAAWLIGPALASNLDESSETLASNKATITRCDSDGVASVFNHEAATPFRIVSVSVSGIASGCSGSTLSVTVNNGLTNSSGSATVPAGGGAVTVTLSSPVALRDATQTEVSLA